MAASNKPIVWGLFAAGGTVAALVVPALALLTLLAALGATPDLLAYERLRAFAAGLAAQLGLFAVICLCLWHAAHRLRITLHDFGLRSDGAVALIVYLTAAVGTGAAAVILLSL